MPTRFRLIKKIMLAQEIIRTKRDGAALTQAQIQSFVRGLVDGAWSEGQVAALAMAIYFRGMDMNERVALTQTMMRSGEMMDWAAEQLPGPVLDKHSTGGVGDKVSLMLAPMVAACGAYVPMISGRGLGHTGGTLDKFDSLKGYQTAPSLDLLRRTVREVGCAIIGQTADLVPADKRLYGIRDVTATVESIPLITASILSKKLAAGSQGLVLDVKVGDGAFASDLTMARELAQSLVLVAQGAGLPTRALITDMNQVLGHSCGNAVEMREAIDFLTGSYRDTRLLEVTRALGAHLLMIGRLANDEADALRQLDRSLQTGAAAERFARMVCALGGPTDVLNKSGRHLAAAQVQTAVIAPQSGWLASMKTRDIGVLVIELGGGRRCATDKINHSVGFSDLLAVGQRVEVGQVLARIHAENQSAADHASAALLRAFSFADLPCQTTPIVIETIDPRFLS
jgi:thymidine phosphorylase